jgi:hypothetical protein
VRERRAPRLAALCALGAAASLAACARPPGEGAPLLTPDAERAILAELLPGYDPTAPGGAEDDLVLDHRIEPVGRRVLAALVTARMDHEGAEPGANATLALLEPGGGGEAGWKLVDERSLGHVWQTEGVVLDLEPAALELAPAESAAKVVFGVESDGEESASTAFLFRVGETGLVELLRFEERDSGSGSPHERVEQSLRAAPAAGRALADLVLETRTEVCEESEGEWRCDERAETRTFRWDGSAYAELPSGS